MQGEGLRTKGELVMLQLLELLLVAFGTITFEMKGAVETVLLGFEICNLLFEFRDETVVGVMERGFDRVEKRI